MVEESFVISGFKSWYVYRGFSAIGNAGVKRDVDGC
jgi:hypothetical protein